MLSCWRKTVPTSSLYHSVDQDVDGDGASSSEGDVPEDRMVVLGGSQWGDQLEIYDFDDLEPDLCAGRLRRPPAALGRGVPHGPVDRQRVRRPG
jgi:hypothetical protein